MVQNLQTSHISQTSFLVGTCFAISYSKTALVSICDVDLTIGRPMLINFHEIFFEIKVLSAKAGFLPSFLMVRWQSLCSVEILDKKHRKFSWVKIEKCNELRKDMNAPPEITITLSDTITHPPSFVSAKVGFYLTSKAFWRALLAIKYYCY